MNSKEGHNKKLSIASRTVAIIGENNKDEDIKLQQLLAAAKVDIIITKEKPDKKISICRVQANDKESMNRAVNDSHFMHRQEKRLLIKKLSKFVKK